MKAVICTGYGPPERLRIEEVEKPVPGERDVLIKVHATTVNRTDCAYLRAEPFVARLITGLLSPRKSILGTDFAGEVAAVGKKVGNVTITVGHDD